MEPFNLYNNYHFETDFYGGSYPSPPRPLPFPLPGIPKFQTLTYSVGTRDAPYIPDVPTHAETQTDLHWQQLLKKVASLRVPEPEYKPQDDWLQVSRRRRWAEDYEDRPPTSTPTPPRRPPSPPRVPEHLPSISQDRGLKSRMSDVTTSGQYGCFYSKDDQETGRGSYRMESGTRFPPIG